MIRKLFMEAISIANHRAREELKASLEEDEGYSFFGPRVRKGTLKRTTDGITWRFDGIRWETLEDYHAHDEDWDRIKEALAARGLDPEVVLATAAKKLSKMRGRHKEPGASEGFDRCWIDGNQTPDYDKLLDHAAHGGHWIAQDGRERRVVKGAYKVWHEQDKMWCHTDKWGDGPWLLLAERAR